VFNEENAIDFYSNLIKEREDEINRLSTELQIAKVLIFKLNRSNIKIGDSGNIRKCKIQF
jgi:hypothetical protein